MANIKVSELPAASAASTSQEFEVNDSGTSKKVTGSQIKSFVKSGLVLTDITDVTASVAELNTLDGITATAAELNVLDGASTSQAPLVLAQPSAFIDPENRIINGAFDFWQRGTSFTTNGYGADRWNNQAIGGTTTTSRQSFAVSDTLGSNSPTYFFRQTASGQTLTSHFSFTAQAIESVRSYAGQTITILGWAKRSSGAGNMAIEGLQYFGTGGSPSPTITGISATIVTLTESWTPFAVVLNVPSITGKTIGTNNNDAISVGVWTSAGSNYNARTNSLGLQTIGVDLWGIHIKRGTHTTDAVNFYKAPELGPELARCQRYYEHCYGNQTPGTVMGSADPNVGSGITLMCSGGGSRAMGRLAFKVRKRVTPTVRYWDQGGNLSAFTRGNNNGGALSNNYTADGFRSVGATQDIIFANCNFTNAGETGIALWEADAEL